MLDLKTFAEPRCLCFLSQTFVAKHLPGAQRASGLLGISAPFLKRGGRAYHHSCSGGWRKSFLDLTRQRKSLEHMDPNVWSKYNSLVRVLQGDFY